VRVTSGQVEDPLAAPSPPPKPAPIEGAGLCLKGLLQEVSAVKFAILVNDAPFSGPAAGSALAFARAVLARGHELVRVFFYFDGVQNANRLAAPPADDGNLVRDWSNLAADHGVELVICITAGLRRGVREANLAPGFRVSGIGQLVEAAILADRLVTFGG
jgi:tRNA 2-thiouridine synthesizing protein D